MAEGLAKKYMVNYTTLSAGTDPESINPLAIDIMDEINIDISHYCSKSFTDNDLECSDLIITLCDGAKDQCINLANFTNKHIHWDVQDPANASGSKEDKLDFFRNIRNKLEKKIKLLIKELN
tara:strand:+ start:274 stop:639 length:366 start_codon:yes stop_codon:yes gene_type:complete